MDLLPGRMLLRERVLAPECGACLGIFTARIARLLQRQGAPKGRVEDASMPLVWAGDHGDLPGRPGRTLDEPRRPGAIAAVFVADFVFGDRCVAHDGAVESARGSAEILRKLDRFDETIVSIGEVIEDVLALSIG